MERKLASVQIIKDIQPVEGADRIEVATILGWKVIVEKDKYKIGEKVVYFEIDSFLPIVSEYEFLRSSSYKNDPILGEGFRIKTRKIRGIYSQGLIMPIEICFKDCMPLPGMDFEVDEDVTELLNVKKYEQPEPAVLGGNCLGKRPEFIKKTNENRLQRYPELLNEFYDCDEIYATVKIDGSSHSIGIDRDYNFHATSHNMELKDEGRKGSFYEFCKEHDLEAKLSNYMVTNGFHEIVVQGEFYGPGIQKNKLGAKKPSWMIFTVDINGERQSLNKSLEVSKFLDIDFVPIVWQGTGEDFKREFPNEETILKRVEGNDSGLYVGQQEGWVIRPTEPKYSPTIDSSLSMKVINNKYLLKNE